MSSQLPKTELKHWLGFNQIVSIGSIRWQRLLNYFPDLQTAWTASKQELLKAGIEEKVAEEIIEKRVEIEPDLELEKIEKLAVKVITILDTDYPKLLQEIYAPPPLLYYLGEFNLNDDFPLAVVGTRKITEYGQQITQQIVSELVICGLTIVSGLALGIDALAHQTAVKNQGKTIAVLGSGINLIYPAANRRLAEKIIESGGGIISEFPWDTPPYKSNFPLRNRIISGLSLGVLVTEGNEDSGALITTKYALDQNREIFSVPGNIYQQGSAGPNKLIKLGAKMVTDSADILETLNLQQAKSFKATKTVAPETEVEKILLELLTDQPLHVDKLAQSSRLDISIVNSTLAVMEMKGLIKNLGGQKYIKTR